MTKIDLTEREVANADELIVEAGGSDWTLTKADTSCSNDNWTFTYWSTQDGYDATIVSGPSLEYDLLDVRDGVVSICSLEPIESVSRPSSDRAP